MPKKLKDADEFERSTDSPPNSDSIVHVEHCTAEFEQSDDSADSGGSNISDTPEVTQAPAQDQGTKEPAHHGDDHGQGAKSAKSPEYNFSKIPQLFQQLSEERLLANGSIHFENVLRNIVLDLSNVLVLKLITWVKTIVHTLCRIYPEAELLDVLRYVDEVFGNSPIKLLATKPKKSMSVPVTSTLPSPAPPPPPPPPPSSPPPPVSFASFSQAEQNILQQILGHPPLPPASKSKASSTPPVPKPSTESHLPANGAGFMEGAKSIVTYSKLSHIDLFAVVCNDIGSIRDRLLFLNKSRNVIEGLRTDINVDQIDAMLEFLKRETDNLLSNDDKFDRVRRASIDSVANTIVMAKAVWKQDLIDTALEDMHKKSSTWPVIDFVFMPQKVLAMRVYLGGDWKAEDLNLIHDSKNIIISFQGLHETKVVIPLPCPIIKDSLKAKFENCVFDMTAQRP